MNKYERYRVDDFLADDGFLHWVLDPSEEEEQFWKKFQEEHPEKVADIREARFVCSAFQVKQKKLNLDETFEIWNAVVQKAGRSETPRWGSFLKYAAVFLLVFLSGAATYYFLEQHPPGPEMIETGEIPSGEAKIILPDGSEIPIGKKESEINYNQSGDELIVNNDTIRQGLQAGEAVNKLIIPYGKKSVVRLSDGTRIWLNAGSQLIYPSVFVNEKREVMLIGEAYFDVIEDREKPFIVRTSALSVRVMGTRFDVSAYPEDLFVETVLESGSVSLEVNGKGLLGRDKKFVLMPNQKGRLNVEDGVLMMAEVDVSQYTSWKEGMLKVEREDLVRVIRKIERYYNIHIKLQDPLTGGYLISGKLDLKDSPEEVLNVIRLMVPVDWYSENDGEFVIVKR